MDEIIYDRILKDGSGRPTYGIEVAKAMKLPIKVINIANTIRAKYYDNSVFQLKTSKYNNSLILGKCLIEKCDSIAEDTHHIKFQSDADCNKMIENMHQNIKCNLVPLCKYHHNMVHGHIKGKRLIINGYLKSGKIDGELFEN